MPKCSHSACRRFDRGGQLECTACGRQTSIVSGTPFQASKLPLLLWFLAMHLLIAAKTNLSALKLKRHLGVCYRTACRVKQKIMQAMTAREEARKLRGTVQIDDAYLRGEINGAKAGRGSPNKQAFLIAVQTVETMEQVQYSAAEVVLANVKRSLSGVYHSIRQKKYTRRYLAEATWRFNRHFDLKALVPRLTKAMVASGPHSKQTLRKASNYAQ